jgi:hypothetical protein
MYYTHVDNPIVIYNTCTLKYMYAYMYTYNLLTYNCKMAFKYPVDTFFYC